VPLAVLREIQKSVAIVPSMAALEASRDRLLEKQLFKSLGILTAPFAGVESTKGIKAATSKFGLPALLKPRLKGMPSVPISEASDCEHAWEIAGPHAVVEARVEVVRAFTLAAARSADGSTQFWPLNDSPLEIQKAARGAVLRLLDALKFVGVMSLEFFEVHGGLLAHSFSAGPLGLNEPRALENHLRAVAGLPLAACE
jgi:5-(carboxyamino)imidazole ribonucleotide synthase